MLLLMILQVLAIIINKACHCCFVERMTEASVHRVYFTP
ncbi:hypothetical protein HBA_0918 [Sodalis endosymbiont of Henestaris halophilus]|nr:hypothetical protein HBA_0918 [Sodalis endosymbiont of Henestaris halophilus]